MLTLSLHNKVLQLFDYASKGTSCLLFGLKQMLDCESIALTSQPSSVFAANDQYNLDDPFSGFLFKQNTTYVDQTCCIKQLGFHLSEQEDTVLIATFNQAIGEESTLSWQELEALCPFIQQAFVISCQISQLNGDNSAVQHVIEHHPLVTQATMFYLDQLKHNQNHIAANQEPTLQLSKEALEQQYGLTQSEAELTRLLFQGSNLDEIACSRSVSKETVRKQLQSILKKTGCDSQEMLILVLFDDVSTRLLPKPPKPLDSRLMKRESSS